MIVKKANHQGILDKRLKKNIFCLFGNSLKTFAQKICKIFLKKKSSALVFLMLSRQACVFFTRNTVLITMTSFRKGDNCWHMVVSRMLHFFFAKLLLKKRRGFNTEIFRGKLDGCLCFWGGHNSEKGHFLSKRAGFSSRILTTESGVAVVVFVCYCFSDNWRHRRHIPDHSCSLYKCSNHANFDRIHPANFALFRALSRGEFRPARAHWLLFEVRRIQLRTIPEKIR